ncbi:MAG: hypothetical protein ABF491_09620, partial [Acetobacter sp.]|uniref:hypothetical protein n=1 Tax=Acetobacter sp. TaxID=440 RepID=UPI0039E91AB6
MPATWRARALHIINLLRNHVHIQKSDITFYFREIYCIKSRLCHSDCGSVFIACPYEPFFVYLAC